MGTQGPRSIALTRKVTTVAELLRARAEHQPDRLGYSFLADGETDEIRLTYAQTDLRASAVAASVRDAGGTPGVRALLLLPPGLDYVAAFFGCLYAGVTAVPAYPPDPFALDRALPRLLAIVRDAGPAVALTTSSLVGYLDELMRRAPELRERRWIAVDAADSHAGHGDLTPVEPEATAVLQYTSGSTSAPRGVMLSHGNLLHNSSVIQRFFGTTDESRGLSWLPPYHDMGLIGGLLQPLYAGCPVTLMSPLHFLEQPMRWLRAADRFRATVSGGPNFAYELCARKSDPAQVAGLDLSSWQVAFNGAEPIRPETLQRFADAFAPAGFRPDAFLPCYGLAEATLIVSGTGGRTGAPATTSPTVPPAVRVDRDALERHVAARPADGPAVRLTSCGRGAADQRIAIVEPTMSTSCAADHVGEIWVSGPSIAQGYWGKPGETAHVFRARIADQDEGPFLRTGDLGFLRDGELVVTGRLKDLIIVRGQNYYPQDIELTAERADPVLRPGSAAAFLVEDDGEDGRLILVLEVQRQPGAVDVTDVAARVRQAVAQEHGLQVHTVALIPAGGMPKTSSGKVQRWQCRDRFRSGELPEIGRREAAAEPQAGSSLPDASEVVSAAPEQRAALLESYLRGQVAALSGIEPDDLDRQQPLLAAGLDSLAVIQLRQRVENDLAASLSLAPLLTGASLSEVVDQLVDQVGERAREPTDPATPAGGMTEDARPSTAEYVAPVSAGQRWMWVVQHLEPESTVYTIAVTLRLLSRVDHAALRRALDTLVSRHPILRTTFPVRDGAPVQLVHPSGQAAYEEHDARDLDDTALAQCLTRAARRPFDLEQGPLLRLDVYRHPRGDVMLLSMHHIVTDFWSMTILTRELADSYAAHSRGREPTLRPPSATFLDVVEWQRSILGDPATVGPLERYWDEQVGTGAPGLALPGVPRGGSPRGGSRAFALSETLTHGLRSRAAAEKVTLHVLLLATFQTLLHGQTGQDALAVAVSAAARTRHEFSDVVGCCTNPLLIRSRATESEPFRALLSRTQGNVIGALEHQDYPMILLAGRHKAAHRGRLLFEALFTFNRSPDGDDLAAAASVGVSGVRGTLGSLQVESFALPPGESTRPLDLAMAEVDGRLHGLLRYGAGALDKSSAERFVDQFTAMLELVATDPGLSVGELTRGRARAGST